MPRLAMALERAVDEPAAAQFRRNEDFPHFLGGRFVHADTVDLEQHHGIGRIERLHRRHASFLLGLVGEPVSAGEGHEVECLATGMNIDDDIGHRQKRAREIVGDLLSDRAIRPAGKLRFMLPLSIGDVRVALRKAG